MPPWSDRFLILTIVAERTIERAIVWMFWKMIIGHVVQIGSIVVRTIWIDTKSFVCHLYSWKEAAVPTTPMYNSNYFDYDVSSLAQQYWEAMP